MRRAEARPGSRRSISSSLRPSIFSTLSRDVAPRSSVTCRAGRSSAEATSLTAASFALPRSGGALTRPARDFLFARAGCDAKLEVGHVVRPRVAAPDDGRHGLRTCRDLPAIISRAMPDMLARLYAIPDAGPYEARVAEAGYEVRRAEPWDRTAMAEFARQFGEHWPVEADRAYNHTPVTAYVAVKGPEIVGFAVYECTRRGYFGPTGVLESLRGCGVGALLLIRCLESMREMGYGYAVIGGVGPVEFYEKVCGATVIPGSEVGVYRPLFERRGRGRD
jgi:GNAT superfamily N-acetyltransferase